MVAPGTSGGGEFGAMYWDRARRPALLTTAGGGLVAGACVAAACVAGAAAGAVVAAGAAGGLVGFGGAVVGAVVAGVEGLLQAASSDAPIARVLRSRSARRVSLDILIAWKSKTR